MPTRRLAAVITGVAGIAAVMISLQSSEKELVDLAEHGHNSALSAAYLQLLSRAKPSDPALGIMLSRNLARAERWDDARAALAPWLSQLGANGERARTELIEIDWSHLQSMAPTDARRGGLRDQLAVAIERLASSALPRPTAARLAHICSTFPDLRLHALLLRQIAGGESPSHARDQAARSLLASGKVREAALAYRDIANTAGITHALSRRYTMLSLDTFIAADDGAGALEFSNSVLNRFGNDGAFINRVVGIALAQHDMALARQLGKAWLAQAPRDPERIDKLLAIELATGELAPALILAQRLVDLVPSTHNRMVLAHVAEWNGQPRQALLEWMPLAKSGNREAIARALALASELGEEQQWFDVARVAARSAPLQAHQLSAMLAMPSRNRAATQYAEFLAEYVDRHSAPPDILLALSAAHEEAGQFGAALSTLDRSAVGLVEPGQLALRQAKLLAAMGETDSAMAKLRPWRAHTGAANIDFWKLLGELAERSGQADEAVHAYQQVWLAGSPAAPVAEWLIARHSGDGDFASTVQIAREAFARDGQARWLLLAIDAAEQGKLRRDLRALLAETGPAGTALRGEQAYWLAKARLAGNDHDAAKRTRALEHARALDAGDADSRVRLMWASINGGDTAILARLLPQFEADASVEPAYWQVFAAANIKLGHAKSALPWLERHLARTPDDLSASFAYADALANARYPRQAIQQRRRLHAALRPRFNDAAPAHQAVGEFGVAYAALVREFDGPRAAQAVLANLRLRGHPDSELAEPMVSALLDQSRFEEARQWLDRARGGQRCAPAWQRLAVALGRHDDEALSALLSEPELALSPIDRITGLQRLQRYPQALAFAEASMAMPEFAGNQALQSVTHQLRQRTASSLEIGGEQERLDSLAMHRASVQLSVPVGPGRSTLAASEIRLRPTTRGAAANAHIVETDISATFALHRANVAGNLTVGTNRRVDSVANYVRLDAALAIDHGVTIGLDGAFNAMSTDSVALRLLGKKDWVGASVTVAPTGGAYARADAATMRYRTRSGEPVARGMRIGAELGAPVMERYPNWKVRLAGRVERNRAEAAVAASAPTEIGGISVPDQAGWAGVGTSVQFGNYEDELGPPYGLIDIEAGRQWPEGRATHAVRAQLTYPLARRHSLRFTMVHANTQGALAQVTTRRASVIYHHSF
jgi:hypothetical protein